MISRFHQLEALVSLRVKSSPHMSFENKIHWKRRKARLKSESQGLDARALECMTKLCRTPDASEFRWLGERLPRATHGFEGLRF